MAVKAPRARRGQRNYHAGVAAEEQVARFYERSGHRVRTRRWRGKAGEIDLVFEKAGEIVFVEVKASTTHARAAESLTARQVGRLLRSAEAYLGLLPAGSLTPMRFDVALVDRSGRLDIIPNALCA
ncbi:YraN family protein [Roseibacterium sp. SDUM158016]|uniref:YraN family protein n=1 Tax=Roseicyclus sediminis TaxID=2980997 RepID=UPI0021D10661|nr:YraN family protein [Roseibacterium sp. SDUM158016]MCU4654408.1 YraN family protein [Roseibacterium sp. SDUM158016]